MNLEQDRKILRELAAHYAAAMQDDINIERKKLHKAVVDLKMIRPVVLIDELPWNELNIDGELTLQCSDPYLRSVERHMRQTLYKWKHIQADMIIPPFIGVKKKIDSTGIGLEIKEDLLSTDVENTIQSHSFHDQMEDEDCLALLHRTKISYDEADTLRRYELLANTIGDLIPVEVVGDRWLFNTLWDDVAQLHGVENLLIDLMIRPEYMHNIAAKFTDIYLDKVRQYDELDLFEGNIDTVHSTTSYTDDLPSKDFDGSRYHAHDVWGRGAAQVFASVSPAQRREFDIEYMKKSMAPFGLVYYGCCEPLHNMIDMVAEIPNLRKISITPWADFDIAAESIGKKYVMAAKATPASVASAHFDEQDVRKELTHIIEVAYKNGCAFDLVLKDISSVGRNPQNLVKWEQIAMELVRNYGG